MRPQASIRALASIQSQSNQLSDMWVCMYAPMYARGYMVLPYCSNSCIHWTPFARLVTFTSMRSRTNNSFSRCGVSEILIFWYAVFCDVKFCVKTKNVIHYRMITIANILHSYSVINNMSQWYFILIKALPKLLNIWKLCLMEFKFESKNITAIWIVCVSYYKYF